MRRSFILSRDDHASIRSFERMHDGCPRGHCRSRRRSRRLEPCTRPGRTDCAGTAGFVIFWCDWSRTYSASMQAMRALRVVQACKWCEEQEGGSCCGAGIENRYDPLQLLINLLLDVSLPDRQKYPDSCYFLETDGCCLKARHVLCVNYLCKKLQENLSKDELNDSAGHRRGRTGYRICPP